REAAINCQADSYVQAAGHNHLPSCDGLQFAVRNPSAPRRRGRVRGGMLHGCSATGADRHDFSHLLYHRMPGVGGNNRTGSFVHSPKTTATERARRLRPPAFPTNLLSSIREISCPAHPVPTRVIEPLPRNWLTPDLRGVVCPPADKSGSNYTKS